MRRAILVLACLACTHHARRVQLARAPEANALSALLHAEHPAAGFQANVAGNGVGLASKPSQSNGAARSLVPSMVDLTGELGATGPLLPYWDPLGLAKDATPEQFRRWRAVELKHGRIAMMATLGYAVQEVLRWPGYLSPSAGVKFADIPNGIRGLAAVPPLGLAQILLFIGLMEVATWRYYEGPWPGSVPTDKEPGDVAGELWVRYTDPEEKKTKLNIELNNGRAAMMGSLGMLMHDHLTGSWIPPGFK
mmetsp:Transcript_103924/g.190313  ORF Transcript_103924/g.190313 Transcript_103924/m.190313 type:complete len:250 (+) Transcript_103924:89-838(+)